MTESGPTKHDIEAVFKKLRAIPSNKVCFDCHAKNPTWSSVTFGVFICLDCSAVHRSLGVHLSFVRSTQLDTNWTWLQLRNMQLGGNGNAEKFFREHNCTSSDAQQKYNSRAAQLYREKLNRSSQQAMKTYGTNMSIDTGLHEHELTSVEEKKEMDFFEEHTNNVSVSPPISDPLHFSSNLRENINNGSIINDGVGPSVVAALEPCPLDGQKASQPRKCTIGQRKPVSKLGAKKMGGLGAQRVKKDFASIEKEAAKIDQLKQEAKTVQLTKEEQEKSLASLQEAYENMGLASKKEEARMKKVDPKKAEQAERLGMALGAKSGISHSMFGEMKTIEQESPSSNSLVGSNRGAGGGSAFREPEIDDDFDTILRFSSGPPKYKDSPFEDRGFSGFAGRGSGIDDLLNNKNKSSDWEFVPDKTDKLSTPIKSSDKANHKYSVIDDHQAQQKFGNAKAISSDMFFDGRDADAKMRSNLSRFEGSSSISSSDLFGDQQSTRRTPTIQTPDLDDVKESVRLGVTKVAGRLSNLATNVMSTIQDRYA